MRRFFLFAFLTACSDTLFYQPEYPLVGEIELICDGTFYSEEFPEGTVVFHFIDPSIDYNLDIYNSINRLSYRCSGEMDQTLLLYREY